jgi:hypothetical protein
MLEWRFFTVKCHIVLHFLILEHFLEQRMIASILSFFRYHNLGLEFFWSLRRRLNDIRTDYSCSIILSLLWSKLFKWYWQLFRLKYTRIVVRNL